MEVFLISFEIEQVDEISMDEVETNDVLCVPDTQALANRLRCCLQVLVTHLQAL